MLNIILRNFLSKEWFANLIVDMDFCLSRKNLIEYCHWCIWNCTGISRHLIFICILSKLQYLIFLFIVMSCIFQVCYEQEREEEVFPLGMNYFDRVLSSIQVRRDQLQLIASTCMFIASKVREAYPITAEIIVRYTACSVELGDLLVNIVSLFAFLFLLFVLINCMSLGVLNDHPEIISEIFRTIWSNGKNSLKYRTPKYQ